MKDTCFFKNLLTIMLLSMSTAGLVRAQDFLSNESFTSESSTYLDTLTSSVQLDIVEDSLSNYSLEIELNLIDLSDTTLMVGAVIDLEDFGSSDFDNLVYSPLSGILDIDIGTYPIADYTLVYRLFDLNGVLIDETQILTE